MNKNLKLLSILTILALSFTGCTKNTSEINKNTGGSSAGLNTTDSSNSSNGQHTGNSSTSSTSSGGDNTSSSVNVETTYKILVQATGQSTVDVVNEAKPGALVKVNVTANEGYRVKEIRINEAKIEGDTFKMPKSSVVVKVLTELIDKDGNIVDGAVSAKLLQDTENPNLWVARNVKVETDSEIFYKIGTETMGITKIDNSKTFANLDTLVKRQYDENSFEIGGNAYYDFYYDASNNSKPLYIQRVGLVNLPSSSGQITALMEGSAMSSSCLYPKDVVGVNYSSFAGDNQLKYSWNLYSDNSSLATVKNLADKDIGLVYKVQEGNVYKVVDSYVEKTEDYAPIGVSGAYSAQYDIVNAVNSSRYQKLQSEVNFEANLYSHDMESLYYDTYEAYRNGFINNEMDDVDVLSGSTVVSTPLANDEFEVKSSLWVSWQNSEHYSSFYPQYRNAYITYDFTATFTKGGAIKKGNYTETWYNENSYDFTNKSIIAGQSGTTTKELVFEYIYGSKKEGKPTIDVTPYFTNKIENITIKSDLETAENTIAVNEQLKPRATNLGATNGYNLIYTCVPATALDAWQYGVERSSDDTVIGPRMESTPTELKGIKPGNADITIGNHTTYSNNAKTTKNVIVANSPYLKGFYMLTTYPYNNYDETFVSNRGVVYCGSEYEIQLACKTRSGDSVMNNMDAKFTISKPELLSISYVDETGKMTITTSSTVTENTQVTVKVTSTKKIADWPDTEFTFTVCPALELPASILGNWTTEASGIVGTSVEFTSATEGTLTYVKGSTNQTYNFTYESYDTGTGKIKTAKIVKDAADKNDYKLDMYIDPSDDSLCVYFAYSYFVSSDSWDQETVELIGRNVGDEYGDEYEYAVFTKE